MNIATKIIKEVLTSISKKYDYFNVNEEKGTVYYSYYYPGGSFYYLFSYRFGDIIMTDYNDMTDYKRTGYWKAMAVSFRIDEPNFEGMAEFLRGRADLQFPDRREEHRTIHQQRVRDVGPRIRVENENHHL